MIPSCVVSDKPRRLSRRSAALLPVVTLLLAIGGLVSPGVQAQDATPLKGDYVGSLDRQPVRLRIFVSADGKLRGTFDNPGQGKTGMPCSDLHVDGDSLSFSVPVARGSWKGSIQNAGATLSGTWTTLGAPVTA